MFIIVLSLGELSSIQTITSHQLTIFILIALITGGPAIFLYYYGLKHISASVSTICELSFPLTAVLLEYFLRGNLLSIVQWIGVLLLIISMTNVSTLKLKDSN